MPSPNSTIHRFSADFIFDGKHFVRDKALITDNDGKILDVIPSEDAGEDVRFLEGIMCPGFINAHCHLELSHLKNKVPLHTGLIDFLMRVMQSRNENNQEEIADFSQKADREMYDNGIVAVGDISNNVSSIPIKKSSALFYHTFVEATGFLDFNAPERFTYMKKVYQDFIDSGLNTSLVPHAPYSVSRSLFQMINDFGETAIISIHNQESEEENKLYERGKSDFIRLYDNLGIDISRFRPAGRSSLKSWLPYFDRPHPLILVHNTFTDRDDIAFAKKSRQQIYWCLCPHANLYIENRMPPVEVLSEEGVKIILGTDSLASNQRLSILEEIKTLQKYFPGLGLENMLSWATQHGAEALHCEEKYGSFEKGKTPGILQLTPAGKNESGEILLSETAEVKRIK
jgi:cytosine/adenosine deaminase-related metal-dependent hydrolase